MEYFNAGAGAAGNGAAADPYAVIPQQFGNGGMPPPQQHPQQQVYFQFADYQQDGASDYDTYQQQQYRAAQQPQQSPSVYYTNQMTAGSYFPIHSASEHDYLTDFLGPQHPPTGASPGGTGASAGGAPYQSPAGNKEFMMQHQQRRGNQSNQGQQSQSQQQPNQSRGAAGAGNAQNQQQQMMSYHQMQAVQQQQQQQQMHHHRLHGAPINPQQFMVPPPTLLQPAGGQQQPQQLHQMQLQHQLVGQQPPPPQPPQQQQQQPAFQQSSGGSHHHHHHQNHNQHQSSQQHNQHHHHHSNQQHLPQHPMLARLPMLKDWPIRCVVEGKYQPAILGTSGATIRDIAHSTHCRVEFVNISKRERAVLGNNDRILTVHGHAEQASKAVARILDAIQHEALKDADNVNVDTTLRLRAHNQLCGRLIGKQGSSIKEIMQKTGTNITVAKYIEPPGGLAGLRNEEILCLMERTIIVRGHSIEQVVQAESLISAKLKKCYESDSQLRAQTMPPNLPPLPLAPAGSGPSSIHPPSLIPTPAGLLQVQHFPPSHHPPTPNNSFLQPGVIQIAPGTTTIRQVRMWVPDSMIGALIGAKGKNIKMIIRETGAAVKIEAPEEKVQREAEEAEKKRLQQQQKAASSAEEETAAAAAEEPTAAAANDSAAAGDQPHECSEDAGTVASGDAAEEKQPKSVPERMVTINGDDLQLLKAQSFVFSKIAETSSNMPATAQEFERLFLLRIRTEVSVPTRIIGRIIGRGGQNVRELQRITGAVVKIPEEERNGGEVFRHEDGLEEDMTMIRTVGNMHSTHNVQFRLAHLVGEYYRSGEHRQKTGSNQQSTAEQQANNNNNNNNNNADTSGNGSGDASPLNMGQLGQVPPISTDSKRNSPNSSSSTPPKSKSP